MIQQIFLYFSERSLQAIPIILVILCIRILLKSAPRLFSYLLWGVVFVRLLFPAFIMFPSISAVNTSKSIFTVGEDDMIASVVTFHWSAYLWLAGFLVLFCYSILQYLKIRKYLNRENYSIHKEEICFNGTPKKVFQSDMLQTSFILIGWKPRIYLPAKLSEKEYDLILMHEMVHLQRNDYLLKLIAYFILILHWYNPFVWLAYHFMCNDMEMSCDEAALKHMGANKAKEYAQTLLSQALKCTVLDGTVGFSKNIVQERIKNITRKKKMNLGIAILISITLIFISILLLSRNDSTVGTINTVTLKVREEASEDAPVIGLLAEGEKVQIVENLNNGFVEIIYNGTTAFVMVEYISMEIE